MEFNKELVDNLNRAKQELDDAIQADMDEEFRDGCWDEIEVAWYALLDEYDSRELERAGITPN